MASSSSTTLLLGRAATGAIAGAILGFVLEPLCFWGGPPEDGQIRLPIVGPIIGAGTCSVLTALCGGISFGMRTSRITVHVLVGTIVGILFGASVFPAALTVCDAMANSVGQSKVFAAYQRFGILVGIPVGAVLGFAVALFRNRH